MRVPNQSCVTCGGRGRVSVPNLGGVFAYRPCPSCMVDQPAIRPAAPAASPPPPGPGYSGGVRVDLGTTDTLPAGFNKFVDLVSNPNVPPDQMVVADLTKKWPFEDNSVDHFRAYDLFEHLPDKVFTMNELYRCLKPGGTADVSIPTVHGVGFISDPQHCSFWSRASFDYFTINTPEHNRFSKQYGITARFTVTAEERSSYSKNYSSGAETVYHLKVALRAIKRNWKLIVLSKTVANLRKAVASVLAMHPGLDPQRIIVVDDGSKAGWTASDPNVAWAEGKKPFVYSTNVNVGVLATADRSDIVLMGDDCEVRSIGAFDFMGETAARADAGVVSGGITGPVGNPLQAFRGDNSVLESPRQMAFVTVCVPRAAIDKVGLLDERFVGYGCEDVDFCWRVQEKGLKLLIDNRARIEHNTPGTPSEWRSRPDITQRHHDNMALLRDKWKRAYP